MKWSHQEMEHKRMLIAIKSLLAHHRIVAALKGASEIAVTDTLLERLQRCQDSVAFASREIVINQERKD